MELILLEQVLLRRKTWNRQWTKEKTIDDKIIIRWLDRQWKHKVWFLRQIESKLL